MAKTVEIEYHFKFPDGREKRIAVFLDHASLALVSNRPEVLPEWTAMGFHRCPNCPLDIAAHPQCPVAANMVDIVDFSKDLESFEEVDVTVKTDDRSCSKHTSVEEGVSSLFSIFMTTSGCPILDRLRPLVDSHLPFTAGPESVYRTLAMAMVRKYFQNKNGLPVNWDLDDLQTALKDVQEVYTAFFQRLNAISKKDGARNAVVILNNLAYIASRALETNRMQRLELLHLEAAPSNPSDGSPVHG